VLSINTYMYIYECVLMNCDLLRAVRNVKKFLMPENKMPV